MELRARAPMWRVFPWVVNTSAWLPQNRPRVYTVGLHASLAIQHILPPPTPAAPCSLLDIAHPGLPRIREHGLTPQQRENLAVAKAEARSHPGCLATISLDRNPTKRWSTGFGVHGVVMALRTGSDLIWHCSTMERQVASYSPDACIPWSGAHCKGSGRGS